MGDSVYDKYDLNEQQFRFEQERRASEAKIELDKLRERTRAIRADKRGEVAGWLAAAAVVITIAVLVFLYNSGPDEQQIRDTQEKIAQIEADKDLKLACINQGGLFSEGQCIWSKGGQP